MGMVSSKIETRHTFGRSGDASVTRRYSMRKVLTSGNISMKTFNRKWQGGAMRVGIPVLVDSERVETPREEEAETSGV